MFLDAEQGLFRGSDVPDLEVARVGSGGEGVRGGGVGGDGGGGGRSRQAEGDDRCGCKYKSFVSGLSILYVALVSCRLTFSSIP